MSRVATPRELCCDVLVAGGGPAGVPAALAAARCGAQVILCQDRHVLGGNASSEVRMHIVGADCGGGRCQELVTEAREGGIIEEIRLDTALRNPQRSPSMLDLIFYEKCRAEPRLTLLLNTTLVGVETAGGRITHALARRESTEDHFRIAARAFIDCTGDGRLGAEAGAPFYAGREAREQYGEPQAPEQADAKRLGSSLLFIARKHDRPMPFIAPPWVRQFSEADLKFRPHARAGVDQGLEYGYWWVEWGGILDTIKDNETIRDELLAIMLGVWHHIKNSGDHGATNWALEWFSFLPGKRESRRFIGQHVLTQQEVGSSAAFPDAVAYGGWPMDIHPVEGVDATEERPNTNYPVPHLFDIPLRALISRDVPNLLFAGRNISATHVAFSSTRVMATCAVMGQAAGTAAAFAVRAGREPGGLAADARAVRAIQQRLLRDDAYIIGVRNDDENDLARQATVSASSAQAGSPAANVLSGQTRAVHGPKGAPPARAYPGTHRWRSDPAAGLPAWLELRWPAPVRLAEVQVVFDTGMHRRLTLSHSDAYVQGMCWGMAQPECVRDYRIEALVGGAWQPVLSVAGNFQRLRRHALSGVPATAALRLVVTATNGCDHARVCELRAYPPGAPDFLA